MTTFVLKRAVAERGPSIELSTDEQRGLLAVKNEILQCLALEDLLNIALENYEEFELELLSQTLKHATYFGQDEWVEPAETIQLVARRFANMLTTAHGYCDQVPHIVSAIFGSKSDEVESVKALFRHEHSTVLGYRVCVELRRYTQHRGSPIHSASRRGTWVDRPDGRRFRSYVFEPETNLRKLADDPKVKRTVLRKMGVGARETIAGDVVRDIRLFVRDYVSALGRVHLKLRAMLNGRIAIADSEVAGAIDRFKAFTNGGSVAGLAVMELNVRGLLEGRSPVFLSMSPIERRRRLQHRNHNPTHFETQVITNEVELRQGR
jgi:hypothetical protein